MPGGTATTRYRVTRKRNTKRLKHTGNLLERSYRQKASVKSRLKSHLDLSQKESILYAESSCARKGTVGIDFLVTSTNGDRKFMQPIRITSRPSSRIGK